MVHVIVRFEIKEGSLEHFVKVFSQVLPDVRAEQGCIQYEPTVDLTDPDVTLPATPHPNTMTLIEKWESVDALKAHLVAEHMTEHRLRVKDMIKSTEIQLLRGVNDMNE